MSQEKRFAFLKQVHELSGGDESKLVNAAKVATDLGLDEAGLRAVTQYLVGEGWLTVKVVLHNIPSHVTITHAGVKAAEAGAI